MIEIKNSFTERVLKIERYGSPWYEFCPQNKEEFNQMVEPFIMSTRIQSNFAVIASVNKIISQNELDVDMVSDQSTIRCWLEAYWALYLSSELALGYRKHGKSGLRIIKTSKPDNCYLM